MLEEFEGIDTVERLLDEMEVFAQKTPFYMPHRVVIPDQEFFRISMALREALPSVIKEARRIIAEKNAIIENAKQEHRKILEAAERRSQELVRDDVIVHEAQQEAERIIRNAREEAEEIKREALIYTDELLKSLIDDFSSALETVNNGRRLVRKFLEKGTEGEEELPDYGTAPSI